MFPKFASRKVGAFPVEKSFVSASRFSNGYG